jgi:hypothetical protein
MKSSNASAGWEVGSKVSDRHSVIAGLGAAQGMQQTQTNQTRSLAVQENKASSPPTAARVSRPGARLGHILLVSSFPLNHEVTKYSYLPPEHRHPSASLRRWKFMNE